MVVGVVVCRLRLSLPGGRKSEKRGDGRGGEGRGKGREGAMARL